MQFKPLALALFVALVSADSVQDLVSQIPSCAKTCLDNASTTIGCATTDLACQCDKKTDLTKAAIVCVQGACSSDDLKKTTTVSAELCLAVAQQGVGSAVSSAVSSATAAAGSAVTSALGLSGTASGTATATATGTAATGTASDAAAAAATAAAGRNAAGVLGAVALAAFAL
ncbi:hypothetical protein F4810DRAFT_91612 [Camillea tinctor]|nr:hypothetical protein F4810DRAFT_91612 [Camillea tinctor]